MDAVIPEDILQVLILVLVVVALILLLFVVLPGLGAKIAQRRQRRVDQYVAAAMPIDMPETHRDDDGHPTAGQQIIAGLEDAVAHARGETGRAKVTQYPRDIFKPWKAGD